MIRTDSRTDSWIARAKAVSIEDAAAFVGAVLKPPHAPERCGPCPFCGGTDRFSINTRKQVYLCRGTGGGGAIDLVIHARGCDFLTACEVLTGEPRPQGAREESEFERQARESKQDDRLRALEGQRQERDEAALTAQERQARQIAKTRLMMGTILGTHAEAYLRARGLTPGPWCDGFGFLDQSPYYDDEGSVIASVPVMIAPIVLATTGEVIGLHRTYLDPDKPAKFRPQDGAAKKFYGRAQGGLIPLGPIGETLMVGEGIETTRWAYQLGLGGDDVTLAAAASLGNMCGACTGRMPHPDIVNPNTGKPILIPNGTPDMDRPGMILPPQVKRLILLVDGDSERKMTRQMITAALRRHRAQGIKVDIQPAPDGKDFADVGMAA